MKFFLLLCVFFMPRLSRAQGVDFTVYNLSLPPELSYYDNQFSSLYIHDTRLFLMTECRLEDKAEPKLYAIQLADLEKKITDTAFVLPYTKYHIYNADLLREKMKEKGDEWEGAEAMVMWGNDVYLSIETTTPSANCYIIKGRLNATDVVMDPETLVTLPKPVNRDHSHIYNAGFENMEMMRGSLYAFFEYNFFPAGNYAEMIPSKEFDHGKLHPIFTDRIPFRITDITNTTQNHFTAINYFYKGGGDDTVYRMPAKETSANRLIKDSTGAYHSYERLIDLYFNGNSFTWKTIWEFPEGYWGYNFEGIAAYKGGYFITNDKFTAYKPYHSVLLYLKKEK